MVRLADGIDVEGPVQAEVFVAWLQGGRPELTGPCDAAPWLIELGAEDHPAGRETADAVEKPVA